MKLSTRMTIAMIALVLFTAGLVGYFIYRNVEAVAVPRALNRIESHARLLALQLEASVRSARSDVIGFRSAVALEGIVRATTAGGVDPADGVTAAQWRARMSRRFMAELDANPPYSQYRIIGVADGGREILRVDRLGPDGGVRIVPDAELQQVGDRDFFRRTIGLPPAGVHITPIELNREHGVIAEPYVPTMRAGATIHTADGRPFGIVVINVDLNVPFEHIRSSSIPGGHSYVTNEQGDYLVNPDRSREFGYQLGAPARLQDDFPQLSMVQAKPEGTTLIATGRDGDKYGVALVSVRLAAGPLVNLVEIVPQAQITLTAAATRYSSLLAGIFAACAATILAIFLARSLSRPLAGLRTAVEDYGRGNDFKMPAHMHGEIGVLAKAFERAATDTRQQAVALTKEIEERRRIFDTSPDLILVTDRRGTFIRVNPASEAVLGYQPEEMIGQSAAGFVVPDDLDRTREEMRAARRGHIVRNFESRYVGKDGRVALLAWSGVWSEPTQQYYFVGRDMTDSRKAAQSLEESNEMARAIIAHSIDAIVQTDQAGIVIEWNPQAEAIFGWTRVEALGQPLTSLYLPPGYRPRYLDMNKQLKAAGDIVGERFEFEAVRKDGTRFKLEVSMTGVQRRDGNVFNLFLRDMTQRIAAEEQLRQAQKMEAVGQLTGGIAHDFNNMLTVITGTIDILAEGVADKPELANIAKLISEAADRGAELTGHLLAFARKQPLQPRSTDIKELITEAEKMLRRSLGEHIEIKIKLDRDTWPAVVDPTQLTSALLNLAVNARDAMPDGGSLLIETANVTLDENYLEATDDVPPGQYVLIAISDTGTGIPEAIRDKIFEPFYSTKDVGKGTGLGLSMVYGFVKQTGGHIRVYSEEGIGTTFKVYLPSADGNMAEAAEPAPGAMLQGGHETILVVEDDALVRTYVTAQLQGLGYKTVAAKAGKDALELIDGGMEFDLLFTDVIMPGGMNGRQLADEAAKRRAGLKVLFTSGYTENAIIQHGRLAPGVLLLTKPYRKSDLARMLRLALAGSKDETATSPRQAQSRAS